jgi:hypothetical protein
MTYEILGNRAAARAAYEEALARDGVYAEILRRQLAALPAPGT